MQRPSLPVNPISHKDLHGLKGGGNALKHVDQNFMLTTEDVLGKLPKIL